MTDFLARPDVVTYSIIDASGGVRASGLTLKSMAVQQATQLVDDCSLPISLSIEEVTFQSAYKREVVNVITNVPPKEVE